MYFGLIFFFWSIPNQAWKLGYLFADNYSHKMVVPLLTPAWLINQPGSNFEIVNADKIVGALF